MSRSARCWPLCGALANSFKIVTSGAWYAAFNATYEEGLGTGGRSKRARGDLRDGGIAEICRANVWRRRRDAMEARERNRPTPG